MYVALVGGPKGGTQALERKLNTVGLQTASTCPNMPLSVSSKAEAILVVRTFVSHKLFDHAQETSRDRGIPLIAISHNWSETKPLLLQSGLCQCVVEPPLPVPKTSQMLQPPAKETVLLMQEVRSLKKQLDSTETLVLDKDAQLESLSEKVARLERAFQRLEQQSPPQIQEPKPEPPPSPKRMIQAIIFTP